nr:MAG TPA: hypothetical protein [Caudoviricetes sp.]
MGRSRYFARDIEIEYLLLGKFTEHIFTGSDNDFGLMIVDF